MLGGLVLIGIGLYWMHEPILTGVARFLVHQDPLPPQADVVVIGGEGAPQVAFSWLSDHRQSKLVIAEKPPPRVVQIGATVSMAERLRQVSSAAGIAENRIEIRFGKSMRHINVVRITADWLRTDPDRKALVICDQFHSKLLRGNFATALGKSGASRVAIHPMPNPNFGIDDWWQNRLGVRTVFNAYLSFGRRILGLYPPEPPPYMTPDEYEQAFLDSLHPSNASG